MRDDNGLVERVVALKRNLTELKESQYTSQDSGMKFIQIDPISTELTLTPPTNFENLAKFEQTFTPEHDFPALLVPTLDISASGATMDVVEDADRDGHRIITFYVGSSYAGYADLFSFYHETSTAKTRKYISAMYYWFDSSLIASIPFTATFNLRATDNGTAAQTGTIINL